MSEWKAAGWSWRHSLLRSLAVERSLGLSHKRSEGNQNRWWCHNSEAGGEFQAGRGWGRVILRTDDWLWWLIRHWSPYKGTFSVASYTLWSPEIRSQGAESTANEKKGAMGNEDRFIFLPIMRERERVVFSPSNSSSRYYSSYVFLNDCPACSSPPFQYSYSTRGFCCTM